MSSIEKLLSGVREDLKNEFLKVKNKVEEKSDVEIYSNLSELTPPRNTPIYLTLNFTRKGSESEGVSLSLSFQNYNPEVERFIVYDDRLFISMDLSFEQGAFISNPKINTLDLRSSNLEKSLIDEIKRSTIFVNDQIEIIVNILNDPRYW
ncbi:MAG: hypothetical protein R8G66_17850 [Cytophagales bacterium]|nr:hypothetical protein [Cytophagales bacterium]